MEKFFKGLWFIVLAIAAYTCFHFSRWETLAFIGVLAALTLWQTNKGLATAIFALAVYSLLWNWSSSHNSGTVQLTQRLFGNGKDHLKNGLVRLDQSTTADRWIKYQVKQDTWPIKCCRKNNFDRKTGQLLHTDIGTQTPLPLEAGTVVQSAFSTAEQEQKTWDMGTWYEGRKYLPVNILREGTHGKLFEFGDTSMIYLVDPDDLVEVDTDKVNGTTAVSEKPKVRPANTKKAATPPPVASYERNGTVPGTWQAAEGVIRPTLMVTLSGQDPAEVAVGVVHPGSIVWVTQQPGETEDPGSDVQVTVAGKKVAFDECSLKNFCSFSVLANNQTQVPQNVTINNISRRKHVVTVYGLDAF